MKINDFKKVKRLLDKAYKEVEREALSAGVELISPEYDMLLEKTRDVVLKKLGIPLNEYFGIQEKLNSYTHEGVLDTVTRTEKTVNEIDKDLRAEIAKLAARRIPTDMEISEIAQEVSKEIATKIAKSYIKPPQVKIVKEVVEVIKAPQIIREQHIEKYDDNKLKKKIKTLSKKVKSIKQIDIDKLKEDLNNRFADNFKKNIDTLGMPDFRKLAMGIQDQVDTLKATKAKSALENFFNGTFKENFELSLLSS